MTTSLRAHRPGIDQQVPLEEMESAGHSHRGGAQVQLTGQRDVADKVEALTFAREGNKRVPEDMSKLT